MKYKAELIKAQKLLSELRDSLVCLDECGMSVVQYPMRRKSLKITSATLKSSSQNRRTS